VTILVEEDKRDKANGYVGMGFWLIFWVVSVFSGLAIGQYGIIFSLLVGIIFTVLSLIHISFLNFPKESIIEWNKNKKKEIDIAGTISMIASISGLFWLILFSMFNNFLWGVFMSLMDPYWLSKVSVEVRWFIWGWLSLWFLLGGVLIAKFWLWKNPIKTLLLINVIAWTVCIFFTSVPYMLVTIVWLFIWMTINPFMEATEQTILQKVVPLERQGRIFGFAQSLENVASPVTAFLVWPLAEFIVIPYMTSPQWSAIFSTWWGTSPDRGIALIFSLAGIIGLMVTLGAFYSGAYRNLSKSYLKGK
jgi:MFS transporter, DHA3 family, multidrug efflux protein